MSNKLRLLMPQWQGGNNPAYSFGAELLAYLATVNTNHEVTRVPIESYDGEELKEEDGIFGRAVLLKQLHAAKEIIEDKQPDKIVVFGGDCLIAQAPITYLNEKYDSLGVLWLDAHPDVSTPEMHKHAHAMVLGNLLGEGDSQFAAKVTKKLQPKNILYGGLKKMTEKEEAIVERLGIDNASCLELKKNSEAVLQWIRENQIQHLVIHLDFDVIDPETFRSVLFAQPGNVKIDAPSGRMELPQVARVINDVSNEVNVVGLCMSEYLPWDAMNLKTFLDELPILR